MNRRLVISHVCALAGLFMIACRPATPVVGFSGRMNFSESGGKVWVEAHLLDSSLRVLTSTWDSRNHFTTRCEDWKLGKGLESYLQGLVRPHLRPGYLPYLVSMDTISPYGLVVLLRGGDSSFLFVNTSDSVTAYRRADSIQQNVVDRLRALFISREECREGHYLFLYPVPDSGSACEDSFDDLVISPEEERVNGYDRLFAGAGRYFEFPVHFDADAMTADRLTQRLYRSKAGCRGTLVREYRDGNFQDNRL